MEENKLNQKGLPPEVPEINPKDTTALRLASRLQCGGQRIYPRRGGTQLEPKLKTTVKAAPGRFVELMESPHPLSQCQTAVERQMIVVKEERTLVKRARNDTLPQPPPIIEKEAKSFLESLDLTPKQMAAFLDDAGSFLYLKRDMRNGAGTAYDLVVVDHAHVSRDNYFTLSCSGMTHFFGIQSEFTPLRRWEREYSLFHQMRCIPFFAKYRAWKNFTVWKKNVKRGKIRTAIQALSSALFLFIPALRDSLLKIQHLCQDTLELTLIQIKSGHTYELDEFEKDQAELQSKRAKSLVIFSTDVQQLARLACDQVVDEFLRAAKIVADHRMTFMERASLRSECRKLTRFLRLVDFHVITTLRELALDSIRIAYEIVAPEKLPPHEIYRDDEKDKARDKKRNKPASLLHTSLSPYALTASGLFVGDEEEQNTIVPLLRVQLQFDASGLSCEPSLNQVLRVFADLLSSCLRVVGIPDRIFAHPDLALYVMSDLEDGGDANRFLSNNSGGAENASHNLAATGAVTMASETSVQDLVAAEERFQRASRQIQQALRSAFQSLAEYGALFDPFYTQMIENDSFVAEIRTTFADVDTLDLGAYASAVSTYRKQSIDFCTVPYAADVGVLLVDSRALKKTLLPSPTLCLQALQTLLPELLDQGITSLLDELGRLLPVVTGSPSNVEQFVAKRRVVKQALESLDRFRVSQQKFVDMNQLMIAEEWPIHETQKAHLVMLKEHVSSLVTGAELAQSLDADDTERFAQDISEEVPQVQARIEGIREQLSASIVASPDERPEHVVAYIEEQAKALDAIRSRADTLAEYQMELSLNVDQYDAMDEVYADLNLKLRLWRGMNEWSGLADSWEIAPLVEMDANQLDAAVQQYTKTVYQAAKGLPNNPVVSILRDSVEKFVPVVPLVRDLRNTSLRPRHWNAIHDLVGFKIQGDLGLTLGDIIEKGVTDHQAEITNIATYATQEAVLEEMMAKVTTYWETAELIVQEYKDVKDLYILGDVTDNLTALDECLVTVNTVLGSRYVAGIRGFVEKWRKNLILFQDTIDEWLACQRGWMYLESIFGSPDIIRQLPAAAKQFQSVDKSFRAIMKATADDPLALKACCVKDRKEIFATHNATLDKIQKSLDNYIETKCSAFPRFYFLSADELLEILSQSKDPQAVQPHLRKLFDNLVRLKFADEPGSIDIEGMYSGEGELVGLGKNLKARGMVEDWLSAVEQRMKLSLHGAMKAGLVDYDRRDRSEWVLDHPGQVVATVAQMMWARGSENALRTGTHESMKTWYDQNINDLLGLIKKIRGNLSSLQRKKIVALVTTDVHARDIVEELMNKNVCSTTDFTWMQQLRYYWERVDEGEDCIIRHSDAVIHYGYEYMGCTSRLVITPLTDRCWLTLTGSYGLKLGAAPAGPAGTGKTESSKDLAKAMAIQCVVFNCSSSINYKMIGKLFRGLAQSGSWVCLDEFNRIDVEVLSVVAQQLLVLREGRLANKRHLDFMGVEILLRDHHVIVTMNPGYAGRTELPDNLQVCFRPVAMMVPDYKLIAEIMLYAEGFADAKTLAKKMCKLFTLCSEQLSQQPHYDYGLRAVKSVLVMAGGLKRSNPDTAEELVLIRALCNSNLPKFLADDIPLFHAIVKDLFPGVELPKPDYGEFLAAMLIEINKAGLQNVDGFQEKVIQLFDIFVIRFGATLVGPTGSGKSTIFRTLASTMSALFDKGSKNPQFQRVEYEIMNPKAVSMGELYGEVNEVTQEWRDGLASSIMRRSVAAQDETRRWTVFDGPVDAVWIENMNTVLDDNQTLCLSSGERIKLRAEMRMLFEVQDLAQASPATVSRIGVVFVSPTDVGYLPYVRSWTQALPEKVPEEVRTHVILLFEKLFEKTIAFQRRSLNEPVATNQIQQATSCTYIFQSLLLPLDLDARKTNELLKLVEKLFFFALNWSVGGSVSTECFEPFDRFLRDLIHEEGFELNLPSSGSSYDHFVRTDESAEGAWAPWSSIVPGYTFDKEKPYTQIVVPTEDTTRFGFIMRLLITQSKPFFLTGVTGTGKTVMIQDTLKRLEPLAEDGGLGLVPLFLNFSAQTSSLVTQRTIESKLEKKRKNLLGAPAGKKVCVFVDDVNMPLVETYGAQPPIELLRQFLDYKGFYDRDKLYWKDITDVMLVTCAAPPGGGRSEVTPRFCRHHNVLCVPPASERAMTLIFESIFGGFMSYFDKSLQDMVQGVVSGTIEVYNTVAKELLPTPARFVYQFNLRDLSKVFQGLLMVTPAKVRDAETLARLWLHETQRVFYDRLINTQDQQWYENLACDLLARHLKQEAKASDHFFGENSVIFADFTKSSVELADRKYENVEIGPVTRVLEDMLDNYNLSFPTKMNLVLFSDAVRHITRMCRILRQPRGNALLVGVGGSGKQSTARLAAFVSEMEFMQIEITRGYGLREFREDMKRFMTITGVEGKEMVFCFTDSQVVDESMLEDINSILNSGEIPNVFTQEELDKVCNDMIPVCDALGVASSRDNCITTFVQRVWDKLHIVLCMSPVGDALRIRCRQFPSLLNCATVDYYLTWPESALDAVASHFLSSVHLGSGSDALETEHRNALVQLCVKVHTSIETTADEFYAKLRRRTYTTPKSYLDLINMYSAKLGELQAGVDVKIDQMTIGTQKLAETNAIVGGLREELKELAPILVEKKQAAEKMLKQVAIDQAEAESQKEQVSVEEAELNKKSKEVAAVAAEAQADLDVAMPALNAAVQALDSLSKSDIVEVKAFKQPPLAVKITMEAVCIMLERKPDWDEAKRVLGDTNFLNNLKGYDKDNIKESVIRKLVPYLTNSNMSVEVVTKVSLAAKGLCLWIHAMHCYHKVSKTVGPKKQKVKEMNAALEAANTSLKEKQDILQAVLDKVQALQERCEETIAQKKELEQQQQTTTERIANAEKLTNGLSAEGVRWKENLELLSVKRVSLIGDTILASAAVSYYGPFTGAYREQLWNFWLEEARCRNLPCAESPTLLDTLEDPVKVREWRTQGLPTDDVSTNNAILVTGGRRYPLCIDPQMQAHRWIRKMAVNPLITTMRDANLLRVLEQAVRNGRPLLVEDLGETIEPALIPVLQKATFRQGTRILIKIADQLVDFDEGFRLYLCTKLPNPHYLPEIFSLVNIINFQINPPALEDQLLEMVVRAELPEVEKKSSQLLMQMAADRRKLSEIEASILKQLSESKGNVLDDTSLINALADSKSLAKMINERLAAAEITRKEISEAREQYRTVATRGSIIYFTVQSLSECDPMYNYSLQYFQALFNRCIHDAEACTNLEKRKEILVKYATKTIFGNICRGLFEKDKIVFSTLMAFSVLRHAGKISATEWNLLIRGATVCDRSTQAKNPMPQRISERSWDLLCALEESTPFNGVCKSITNEWSAWNTWISQSNPNRRQLPAPFHVTVSAFGNLLLVKALRDDKVVLVINTFVHETFGSTLADPPAASMDEVYADLDNATPCIFILSKGSDPSGMLFKLAKAHKYSDRLHLVSLGQGQGPTARALVEKGCISGDWVCLQNCMLAKSFMPDLEALVFELGENREKNHADFRLFLTSSPASYFPVSILQNGVKMTNEAPKGIRANMIRAYANLVKADDLETNAKPEAYKRLLSGLCFFHANILERRKFGPLGWNIRYAFDESDLETSMAILRRFLNEQDEVPWDALRFVTGHICYGGRVTDDFDRRTLLCILGIYFNTKVLTKDQATGDYKDYTFSESGIYKPASTGNLESHLEYFKSLPAVDEPEIFGMHENADITFNRAESTTLSATILHLQPRENSEGTGKSAYDIVTELITEIESKTPEHLDDEEAGEATFVINPENGLLTSLDTVLKQEVVKFNRLINRMKISLTDLRKAINGIIVMSSDLDQMYTAFLNNELPNIWNQVSFASLKTLGSWVKDVVLRVDFMRTWLRDGLPSCFPLPVFFFPQGFMTGTLQTYARKYKVAIDTLQFEFSVLSADIPQSGPDDGVYISGLFMEGARWDFEQGHVCDSRLGEVFVPMPVIHFKPAVGHKIPDGWYSCPVYKTAERKGVLSTTGLSTNFVVAVELPSSTDPTRWIMAGAACLCNLTD